MSELSSIIEPHWPQNDAVDQNLSVKLDISNPSSESIFYSYDYLLNRFFQTIKQDIPSSNDKKTSSKKSSIPAPKLEKKGGKKILWTNFSQTCQSINRDLEHVKLYMLTELTAEGSLDGNNNLNIVGKFNSEMILTILKKYVQEYVTCKSCQKSNTTIYRKNRLSIVKCESCFSERTVDQMK